MRRNNDAFLGPKSKVAKVCAGWTESWRKQTEEKSWFNLKGQSGGARAKEAAADEWVSVKKAFK